MIHAFLVWWWICVFGIPTLLAQSASSFKDLESEINLLEGAVRDLSEVQAKISENQQRIQEELATLKIWIHRRHRG